MYDEDLTELEAPVIPVSAEGGESHGVESRGGQSWTLRLKALRQGCDEPTTEITSERLSQLGPGWHKLSLHSGDPWDDSDVYFTVEIG
uniref:Uncharacterized protein n=1 Tax=Chromera velia CCMP2878 TaxID=1169474 RepID=A0A0G4H4Z8_9ALVE|eukprot:Cvel_5706.t1-p1 / transcript=Cvel_5706.t1 / gene=Cvel_5706 / organism=Chromera_velia_CCMP2878 / gene_product=hypothetical protein / transcript_product=hypothetical protein / location=Cvel_scaffold270:26817-27077(+) / protein_length=87 / sequence_SO=supercontig / SO=protein_coding / is_pseudo=false